MEELVLEADRVETRFGVDTEDVLAGCAADEPSLVVEALLRATEVARLRQRPSVE